MDEGERVVLISIRPRFANAILNAEKSVELRRTKINVAPGTRFLIYSTSPVMAVTGTAVLDRVETDTPERLWTRIEDLAHLPKAEYVAYFAGAAEAFALHLTDPIALERPIPLAHLRKTFGVEPNQSFRYLDLSRAGLIAPISAAS